MPLVAVLTGSKSDLPTLEACTKTLDELGIEHEIHVMSAHRSPAKVQQFAGAARENGFEVIIAAAGMSAHLPGVVAAYTALPVIGVPISSGDHGLSGMDALLSIVQMPPGVPVACVAVNGAKNAALLAAAILALKHENVRNALDKFQDRTVRGLTDAYEGSNASLILEHVEAENANDPARVLATYSRESPVFEDIPSGKRYVGGENIVGNYRHLWEGFPGLKRDITRWTFGDDSSSSS